VLKKHHAANRIVASIAEGHSVLISAGLLAGGRVASLPEMRTDVENAGANWVDSTAIVDNNLVTAGGTPNLPKFLAELLRKLEM
jgi:protease I